MLFKLSNLISNLALALGYLNPALNNSAQSSIQFLINLHDSVDNSLLLLSSYSAVFKYA